MCVPLWASVSLSVRWKFPSHTCWEGQGKALSLGQELGSGKAAHHHSLYLLSSCLLAVCCAWWFSELEWLGKASWRKGPPALLAPTDPSCAPCTSSPLLSPLRYRWLPDDTRTIASVAPCLCAHLAGSWFSWRPTPARTPRDAARPGTRASSSTRQSSVAPGLFNCSCPARWPQPGEVPQGPCKGVEGTPRAKGLCPGRWAVIAERCPRPLLRDQF